MPNLYLMEAALKALPITMFSMKALKKKEYFCKYCGAKYYTILSMTSGACSNSPNGHHIPYEGAAKNSYKCKYCGSSSYTLQTLTSGSCAKSPNKHHQPA
ncbi:hypothetical protein M9Y10_021808 [Tritrichomonas musculus]|uniref:Uncharacterized protein n=1 Tax=Tritrichomonas musculus TaxID=1915356 RepID=A0ABR2KTS0_9EUKA